MFSARFDQQDEVDRVLDETDLYINLKLIRNLTESDVDNFDVGHQLEQQVQNQESKKIVDSDLLKHFLWQYNSIEVLS